MQEKLNKILMVETISSSSEKRREVKMARARNPGMDGKRCNRKS